MQDQFSSQPGYSTAVSQTDALPSPTVVNTALAPGGITSSLRQVKKKKKKASPLSIHFADAYQVSLSACDQSRQEMTITAQFGLFLWQFPHTSVRTVTAGQQKASKTVTARITGRSELAKTGRNPSNLHVMGVVPPMSSVIVERHHPVTQVSNIVVIIIQHINKPN